MFFGCLDNSKIIYSIFVICYFQNKLFLILPNSKHLANSKIVTNEVKFSDKIGNPVEKGKTLINSTFYFFHNVFKHFVPQGHSN